MPQGRRLGRAGGGLVRGARSVLTLGTMGASMLEVAFVAGLVAIVLAVVVPRLNFSPHALRADTQELTAALASARSFATSRVTHYRVRVTGPTTYAVERGELVGADWVFTLDRTITLRADIEFTSADITAVCGLVAGAGRCAEFHSRGGLAGVAALDLGPIFTLQDTRRGWVRQIKVWGTGLVEGL